MTGLVYPQTQDKRKGMGSPEENTIDMIARSRRRLVDLVFRLRYPDPKNLKLRVPYGYEFVERLEERAGYELDQ